MVSALVSGSSGPGSSPGRCVVLCPSRFMPQKPEISADLMDHLARMQTLLHELSMNQVTKTFILVSSSASSKQLMCFVHGQDQKRTKTYNKELCRVS